MRNAARLIMAFVGCAVLLGGCEKHSPKPTPTAASTRSFKSELLRVSYSRGHLQDVEDTVPLTGTLVVDKSVNVPSRIGGQITSLSVEQGQRVSAGQVLATVDTDDALLAVQKAQAELKQQLAGLGLDSPNEKLRSKDEIPDVMKAKATLDNAKLNYERYKTLHKQHLVSDVEYSDKETAYITARASYQAALESASQSLASVEVSKTSVAISRKKLSDSVIVAPVSGIVDQVTTAVGAYVSEGGDSGIVILKDRPMFVNIDVPQQYLPFFRQGGLVKFVTPAYPKRVVSAQIHQIGGRVNPNSGALPARAMVLSPPDWLYPGMSAQVQLFTGTEPDRLLIPQAAVLTQAGKSKVFVVKSANGNAAELKSVSVKTGHLVGQWVVIHGEVRPEDRYITSDLLSLEENSKVILGEELKVPKPESLLEE